MDEFVGVIHHDATYTREEFCGRMDMSADQFRKARREGLRTVKVGNNEYVTGRDFAQFLETAT